MPSLFQELPPSARIWIYGADRALTPSEQEHLLDHLRPFLAGWRSHGRSVNGRAAVLEDRFLVVAADLPEGDISGCGIDASVHAVEEAGRAAGRTWLSALTVFFRDDRGAIQAVSRPEFRRAVRAGAVTAETPVFDLTPGTLGDVRAAGIERPAASSWHGRVFRIPAAV